MLAESLDREYIADFWQDRIVHADSVSVCVPGSTANLGPGFDTIALALATYLRLTVTLLKKDDQRIPLLTNLDPDQAKLGDGASHFVERVLSEHWKSNFQTVRHVRVLIQSEIPAERGLGSSAAVAVGVLWGMAKITGQRVEPGEILRKTAVLEGHVDNAAASLLGGLAIVVNSGNDLTPVAKKLAWPEQWEAMLVIPERQVPTSEARRVLPGQVPYEDAIYNLQHTAMLLAAVQHQSEELMHQALHDRLHEKYRAQLVPELFELKRQLYGGPSLGCVLSGSGSSVLVLAHRNSKKTVIGQIELWQSRQTTFSKLLALKVDQLGLQELH